MSQHILRVAEGEAFDGELVSVIQVEYQPIGTGTNSQRMYVIVVEVDDGEVSEPVYEVCYGEPGVGKTFHAYDFFREFREPIEARVVDSLAAIQDRILADVFAEGPKSRVVTAQYRGTCLCGDSIEPGDAIVRYGGNWCHDDCNLRELHERVSQLQARNDTQARTIQQLREQLDNPQSVSVQNFFSLDEVREATPAVS